MREDIKKHQIAIFSPAMDEDDEADVSQQIMVRRRTRCVSPGLPHFSVPTPALFHPLTPRQRLWQATLPFALVGSNDTYQVAGSAIRGRMYPWGIVEGGSNKDALRTASAPARVPRADPGLARHRRTRLTLRFPLPFFFPPAVDNPDHCDFSMLRDMIVRCGRRAAPL